MVFYSRYFIHEMLLVFFSFLALAAGWRYWRSRKLGWALLAGAGLGLMHATKETFVITLAAAALALALNRAWNRWLDASGSAGQSPAPQFSAPGRRPGGLARSRPGPVLLLLHQRSAARWIQSEHTVRGWAAPAAVRPISIPGPFIFAACSGSRPPKAPSGARR